MSSHSAMLIQWQNQIFTIQLTWLLRGTAVHENDFITCARFETGALVPNHVTCSGEASLRCSARWGWREWNRLTWQHILWGNSFDCSHHASDASSALIIDIVHVAAGEDSLSDRPSKPSKFPLSVVTRNPCLCPILTTVKILLYPRRDLPL